MLSWNSMVRSFRNHYWKNRESEIRNHLKAIKKKLNLDFIHFRKLRNFEQRSYIVNEIAKFPFEYINIIVDTTKIKIKALTENDTIETLTYNFACKMLLERFSAILTQYNYVGDIVLSSRGTSRDQNLISYIKEKLLPYNYNSIDNTRIDKVMSKSAREWEMLQLADVCATSMFYAHEINSYGFITPCYTIRLKNHLYMMNRVSLNYGIKYYANEMKPDSNYFHDHTLCKIGG